MLQACDISYSYTGGGDALRAVNLRIRAGCRLAVLGANGSGKTTLLLHLNGTIRPRTGIIRVDGEPVSYTSAGLLAWRQRVGLVFQDPDDQLFAATVRQDVSFGPMNLRLPVDEVKRRVAEALEALDIADLADRPTHALSHGQRKLAAIAGVLAMRPHVMILDEPTAGLDTHAESRLLKALDRLHQKGTVLVLATHDMELAYAWADEVALLDNGSVLKQGVPVDIMGDADLLDRCHLRTPWALKMVAGFLGLGRGLERRVLPRSPEGVLSYCRQAAGGMVATTGAGRRPASGILLMASEAALEGSERVLSLIDDEVRGAFPERAIAWACPEGDDGAQTDIRAGRSPGPRGALGVLRQAGCQAVVVVPLAVLAGPAAAGSGLTGTGDMQISLAAPLLGGTRDLEDLYGALRRLCRPDCLNLIIVRDGGPGMSADPSLRELGSLLEQEPGKAVLCLAGDLQDAGAVGRFDRRLVGCDRVHIIRLEVVGGMGYGGILPGDGEDAREDALRRALGVREVTLAPLLGELPEVRRMIVRRLREVEDGK